MHRFNGYDIEITRGDSLFFIIHLDGRELPDGSVAYFTVKSGTNSEENVIRKRIPVSAGTAEINLSSEDTYLPVRTYYWDVRLLIPRPEGGYEVETPMEYAAFTVIDAIGYPGNEEFPPGTDVGPV